MSRLGFGFGFGRAAGLRGSAVLPFDPTQVAGGPSSLMYWLDSQQAATVTGSGWNSRNSGGLNFTGGGILHSSGFAGGSNPYVDSASNSVSAAIPGTWTVGFAFTCASGGATFLIADASPRIAQFFNIYSDFSGNAIAFDNAGNPYFASFPAATFTAGNSYVVIIKRTTTTLTLSINGASPFSGAISGTAASGTETLWFMNNGSGTAYNTTRIAESTMHNYPLAGSYTAGDEAKLAGYLAWNTGIQSQLVAGHPYKTVRP